MMSANAPPLMLISSTMPSKPVADVLLASILNRFLNVSCPPPGGTGILGVTSSVVPTVVLSGAKASLGALLGVVAEVTHATSLPVAALVQPAGRAGTTAPSKASVKLVVVTVV